MKKDYHVHSTYSDGKDAPEELVLTAIERNMTEIGFSDHSYTFFDESYCIQKDKITSYIEEIASLKEKYRKKIKIFCGIEQDYYSDEPTDAYDYVIGSVHYIKIDGKYIPVDENVQILLDAVQKHFGGDVYALIDKYYETVSNVVSKTGADIIGHFDLISKFNEKTPFFDESDGRYISAYQKAADKLIKTGKTFEINVGAMSRGKKSVPYPSPDIQKYLKEHGAKFIIAGDVHNKDFLGKDYL